MAPGPDSRLLKIKDLLALISENNGTLKAPEEDFLFMPGKAIAYDNQLVWKLAERSKTRKNFLTIAEFSDEKLTAKLAATVTAKAVLRHQS